MRRGLTVLVLCGGLVWSGAAPASALPHEAVRDTVTRTATVSDDGEACGFPVRWDVDLTGRRTRYYDDSGRLVRAHFVIREDNTITNVETGLTLREGPDAFLQVVDYGADGTVTVTTIGTSVNVRTEWGRVLDQGRFVVRYAPGQAPEIVANVGPHVPRELLVAGGEQAALAAFCDVLDPPAQVLTRRR